MGEVGWDEEETQEMTYWWLEGILPWPMRWEERQRYGGSQHAEEQCKEEKEEKLRWYFEEISWEQFSILRDLCFQASLICEVVVQGTMRKPVAIVIWNKHVNYHLFNFPIHLFATTKKDRWTNSMSYLNNRVP